jgi:hypothetical protein
MALSSPVDVILGAPAGWIDGKAAEINGKLDGVEKLLWLSTGAAVLTAAMVLLFRTGSRA